MWNVLRTEWLKIKNYPAFWLVLGMTALSYPGINYMFYNVFLEITKKQSATGKIMQMMLGNPFTFPEVFHTTAFFSSIFVFIPAIVVIMLITNEYTYKTHRQNIIDGWSRDQFLLSKFIDVALITAMVTLLYFIIAMIIGYSASPRPVTDIWSQRKYIGLFALMTSAQLSFAFLIGIIVRKSFIAMSAFTFYWVMENGLVNFLKVKAHDEGRFFPLEISDRLIPIPAFIGRMDQEGYNERLAQVTPHIWYTLIMITAIWTVCYLINRRRDL